MLNVSSVISIITAPPGSGKTFSMVRYLMTELLPHTETTIISNLPLNVDEIVDDLEPSDFEKREKLHARLQAIPPEILEEWQNCQSTPLDYFLHNDKVKLEGSLIILDEAQYYIGGAIQAENAKVKRNYLASWSSFLSELRHCKAKIWLITQTTTLIEKFVRDLAGNRIVVIDQERLIDPIFKIPMADWLQLWAKFSGDYITWVRLQILENTDGKWDVVDERQYIRNPNYFRFYNSFSARQDGKGGSNADPKHEFTRHGYFGMFYWFFRRNILNATPSLAKMTLVFSAPIWIGYVFPLLPTLFMPKNMAQAKVPRIEDVQGKDGQKTYAPKSEPPEKAAGQAPPGASPREVAEMVAKTKDLEIKLKEAADEREKLRKQIEQASAVRALTPRTITFQSGDIYATGETITFGLYEGAKLVSIDFIRKTALLSSGVVLRLPCSK